jgi:hypothetical protein
MLDEAEWALVERAREEGMDVVEEERRRRELPRQPPVELVDESLHLYEDLQAMLAMYRLLTGYEVGFIAAVHDHRMSRHGPPCPGCEKPLRSRRARYCVACGFGMEDLPGDVPPLVERRADAFDFVEVPW